MANPPIDFVILFCNLIVATNIALVE